MAYSYPSNQQALKDIHWRQASDEGREFDGRYLLSELPFPNAWGDYFPLLTIINGIERRQAENNAQIAALASAIAVATTNPDITAELVQQTLRDALQNFTLTLAPKQEG